MNYAVEGNGEPVIILHGTYGGLEQSKLLGESLKEEGYKIIALSRPGYPGTDIEKGRTPEEQADLVAELMEKEGIESAHLLGYSAGGEIALQFILRHPEKVGKIIMDSAVISAVSQSYRFPDNLFTYDIAYRWPFIAILDKFLKKMAAISPKRTFRILSGSEPSSKELNVFQEIINSAIPLKDRKKGIKNDFEFLGRSNKLSETIEKPLLAINYRELPTIVQTTEKLEEVCEDNLEKKTLDGGGHMTWMQSDDRKKKAVIEFLQ